MGKKDTLLESFQGLPACPYDMRILKIKMCKDVRMVTVRARNEDRRILISYSC